MDITHLDIAHLVQSALAPVFLLSAIATTLVVLTNRLARAVDRARALEDRVEKHVGNPQHLKDELLVLARRARYINAAISMCAISALLIALCVVTLFANAFFGAGLAATIALLFVGAMLLITAAFVAFFIEVRLATAALRIGIEQSSHDALPPQGLSPPPTLPQGLSPQGLSTQGVSTQVRRPGPLVNDPK
jgi:hypothetical protein